MQRVTTRDSAVTGLDGRPSISPQGDATLYDPVG
jgi:hypothetical protein